MGGKTISEIKMTDNTCINKNKNSHIHIYIYIHAYVQPIDTHEACVVRKNLWMHVCIPTLYMHVRTNITVYMQTVLHDMSWLGM